MKLTNFQINLFIIFFLIILVITLYYINDNKNVNSNNKKYKESFDNSSDTNPNPNPNPNPNSSGNPTTNPNPSGTTNPNPSGTANTPRNTQVISNPTTDIKLNDKSINDMITSYTDNLAIALSNFNILDLPITINNNNKLCEPWGTYNNSKYKSKDNQCLIVDGETERKCLLNSNLVPCSNYYSNINNLNFVNTDAISSRFKENINKGYSSTNQHLLDLSTKLKLIIDNIVLKINIENQQKYFIQYNDINLDDKTKLVNKTTEEFEKAENNLNINQLNFSVFLEKNNNNDSKNNFYYKILIIIIIIIVIVGILNLIFTEF